MTTTLFRGALTYALLSTTALTVPAMAQSSSDLPPPARYQVDSNGVDLARDVLLMNVTDVAIGPSGRGGLAYVRQLGSGSSRNPYDMGVFQTGATSWSATAGLRAYEFSLSGTTFTSTDGSGAALTKSGTTYTLTTEDGTTVTYAYTTAATGDSMRKARATNVTHPTGEQTNLSWVSTVYCSNNSDGCGTGVWRTAVRLQGVSSSLGYQLHFNYGLATAVELVEYNMWKRLDSITAINTIVDSCNPAAHSCSLTQTWPTVSYSGSDVTDPAGRTTRYTATGSTFSIRRPSSTADNIIFNIGTTGNVTSVVRDGLTWAYNYSVSGAVATMVVTDPGSHTSTIISDLAVGLPTSVTDEVGQVTNYSYDSAGRLQRITAPEGNYVEYSYDGRGNVTQVLARDKAGNSANDIITHADYLTTCSNPVVCNLPTATRDARGNQTDYTYDSTHGGPLTVTLPAPTTGAVRPQTRFTYSSLTAPGGGSVHRVTQISQCQTTSNCADQADEARTTIAYSQANLQPSGVTAASGDGALSATSTIGYDYIARPITVDGPLSGSADTSRTRYDLAGAVIGTVSPDPDGSGSLKHRAQRISYNGDGQVSRVETGTVNSQSDGDWAEVQQDYDSSARPTVQRLVSGSTTYAVTQTSYDSEGRVACLAQRMNPSEFASLPSDACTLDSEGSYGPDRIIRTTYDNAGRVTLVQSGYGVTGVAADEVATTYSNNGQVATVTDGEGNRTTYEYDGFDRLVKTRYPSTTQGAGTSSTSDYEQLTLDANGNVTNRRLRDNTSIAFTYDALNRVTAKDLPGSEPTVSYAYDLLGRLTGASVSGHSLSFTFDALGRNLTQAGPQGTASYQYDAAGRRTRLTYPGSGLYVDYDYDAAGDMIAIRENGATSGAGVLATFAYDDRGRRTSLTRGNGTVTSYAYNNADRLTQLVQNLNGTASDLTLDFSHNPASQITSATRSNDAYAFTGLGNVNVGGTYNGLNQISTLGTAGLTWDARGNLASIGPTGFTYASENMLTGVIGITLAYDPLLRLYENVAGGTTYRFAYDGGNLIAEYDGSDALQRRYVHGPGVDEPLVWYEGTGTSDRRWLHADERGSIIATSDGSGNATNISSYDEYGLAGTANAGRFQYTGQVRLSGIALLNYRARIYWPGLGRFLQTDPIGYGGGMNLYAYVGNDPVNSVDPSGLGDPDKPKPKCASECWGPPLTGTRIPGWAPAGLFGYTGAPAQGVAWTGLYKVTDWGPDKTPSTWFEVRLGAGWGFAAKSGGSGCNRTISSTLCAMVADPEVRVQMGRAWALSMGDEATAEKNEYGFWLTPVGNDFTIGEMLRGNGPRIYQTRDAWTPGATIFFHVHPFYAGEIRGVTSIALSPGDFSIARDFRALMIAMARPGRGIRHTFSFFEFDCRMGC